MGGEGECPAHLQPQCPGNSLSRFFVDGLPLQGLVDSGAAHPGLPGKGGQRPALCADPLPQVDLADAGGPVADALLLEVLVEAVDVAGAEVAEPDVADSLVDAAQVFRVGGYGLGLEVELGVLRHEFFGEIGEAHIAVGRGPAEDLFLKEDGLPVQLLFDLPVAHPRLGDPGHVLPDALAVAVVALGDRDLIALSLFCNGCH